MVGALGLRRATRKKRYPTWRELAVRVEDVRYLVINDRPIKSMDVIDGGG